MAAMASRLPVWIACSSSAVLHVEDRVGARERRRQHAAGLRGGQADGGRRQHDLDVRDGQALATLVTPPVSAFVVEFAPRIEALTLSGWPSSAVAGNIEPAGVAVVAQRVHEPQAGE